ncbi:aldolase [Leucogyrophana mollusca]|uniref:Aldolase n=1 Tax=Leucogyrophana mollusca TaxID=85980 RepID=A0ACB8BN07_9AGAM|nr:aldolase [Leucogyrophana mollusca]
MSTSRRKPPSPWTPQQGSSGTYAVGIHDGLTKFKEDLTNIARRLPGLTKGPPLPYGNAAIIGDTVDLQTLAFHEIQGCNLTPENVAERMETNDIRYHAWVAAKRVVEEERVSLDNEPELLRATTEQFLVELGLALLDLVPQIVTFVDPRLYEDAPAMVTAARALMARFDAAGIEDGRVIVTVPATEQGVRAAHELSTEHSIHTNLTLVSGLLHATACIEAGVNLMTMSVGPLLEWFEQKIGGAYPIAPGHPGIEVIQSCASYIQFNGVRTRLMTADIRTWSELKQLNGLAAVALNQQQLDRIPRHTLTTWFPSPEDASAASLRARQAQWPPTFLQSKKGFMSAMSAESRSMVSAVLFVGLGKMNIHMEKIDGVIRQEVRRRVELETGDLRSLYSRDTEILTPTQTTTKGRMLPSPSESPSAKSPQGRFEKDKARETGPLIEGVDYF